MRGSGRCEITPVNTKTLSEMSERSHEITVWPQVIDGDNERIHRLFARGQCARRASLLSD